jgi:hypothetical protein
VVIIAAILTALTAFWLVIQVRVARLGGALGEA